MNAKLFKDFQKYTSQKKSRENNAIIFGIPEDNENNDLELVKQLVEHVAGKVLKFNHKRLGKRQEEPEIPQNRPTLVIFENNGNKKLFMSKLTQLKQLPENLNTFKITVRDDLTPEEREEEKKLLNIAIEKSNSSEAVAKNEFYVVRGPPWKRKIVTVPRK